MGRYQLQGNDPTSGEIASRSGCTQHDTSPKRASGWFLGIHSLVLRARTSGLQSKRESLQKRQGDKSAGEGLEKVVDQAPAVKVATASAERAEYQLDDDRLRLRG
jgi:hypothetical protein